MVEPWRVPKPPRGTGEPQGRGVQRGSSPAVPRSPHPKKLRKAGPERASTPLPVPSRVPPRPPHHHQHVPRASAAAGMVELEVAVAVASAQSAAGPRGRARSRRKWARTPPPATAGPEAPAPGRSRPAPRCPQARGAAWSCPLLGSVPSVLCFFGVFWCFWGFLHPPTRGDRLTVTPPLPGGCPKHARPSLPHFGVAF